MKSTSPIWRALPWIGELFRRRAITEELDWGPRAPKPKTLYSVCALCERACGISVEVVSGVARKVAGSPYHPASCRPHARYSTAIGAAKAWPRPLELCENAEQILRPQQDPFRLSVPLKRSGPRGSGKWKVISWEALIREVAAGGTLFSEIPGEEDRSVDGLASVLTQERGGPDSVDSPRRDDRPVSPVMLADNFEKGRSDFFFRFASSFGTGAIETLGKPWDGSHPCGIKSVLGEGVGSIAPDGPNADYVLRFGAGEQPNLGALSGLGRAETGNETRYRLISDLPGGIPKGSVHVRSGGYGALAMGMVRWIIENEGYASHYLSIPSSQTAAAEGYPNFSDASWLVISDPHHPRYGMLLDAETAGIPKSSQINQHDRGTGVVIDPESGKPQRASSAARGKLWPTGNLSTDPIIVNGLACCTGLQLLYSEARALPPRELCGRAGAAPETIATLAKEFSSHGTSAVADLTCSPALCFDGPESCRAIVMLNVLVGSIDWIGGCAIGGGGADCMGNGSDPAYRLEAWPVGKEGTSAGGTGGAKGSVEGETLRSISQEGGIQAKSMDSLENSMPQLPNMLIWHFNSSGQLYPSSRATRQAADLLKRPDKIPLFIAIDTVLGELSSYADYVVPDTSALESWGFPSAGPGIATKAQGVRQPVVESTTAKTPSGRPISMEQFLIDLAVELELPGFGQDAFVEGGSLEKREDFYLKVVANIAYDSSFKIWKNGSIENQGPTPNANPDELKAIGHLRAEHSRALSSAQWHKAAYVLARGGRFENYEVSYLPSFASQAALSGQIDFLIPDSTAADTVHPNRISAAELRNLHLDAIALPILPTENPRFMTHRFGEMGTACRIRPPSAMSPSGEKSEAPRLSESRPIPRMDGALRTELPADELNFYSNGKSFAPVDLTSSELLSETESENYAELSAHDARRLGFEAGARVLLWSASLSPDHGIPARLRISEIMEKGSIAITYAFSIKPKRIYSLRERKEPCRSDLYRLMVLPEADADELRLKDGGTVGAVIALSERMWA